MTHACLIGFGEVGQTLADDLSAGGVTLSAWDVLFAEPDSKIARACAANVTVRGASSSAEAVRGATIVISAVTARQTIAAAQEAAAAIEPGALYLDLNSASPEAKIEAARIINGAGGRYVEAAVMSPIAPKRIATAMLLGGPHAGDAAPLLRELGFSGAQSFSSEPGKVAAAKLCRSVIVKGMEALLLESLVAARRYQVDDTVLQSLNDLFPSIDWRAHSRYMISRAIEHGKRRSHEMAEAANTVRDAGLAAFMSGACVGRQAEAPKFKDALAADSLEAMLDQILAQIDDDDADARAIMQGQTGHGR